MGFFWKENLSELVFPKVFEVLGKKFSVEVVFLPKRSSSVFVKPDKVIFRLSSYLSKEKAYEHFNSLMKRVALKIERSMDKGSGKYLERPFKDFLEEGGFVFCGEIFSFQYTKNRGVKLKENVFFVNPSVSLENLEKKVPKFLSERFYPRVLNFVSAINSETFNYSFSSVVLKLVGSKWGHCTKDNSILINLKLLNSKIEILRYVIIHELAHIRHKNHGDSFWGDVSRFCPNYKVLRKDLKEHPPQLFVGLGEKKND